ncbi:EamA family transporter [Actinocorallia populi]|uniref:EamA family transporter n=1 Tax=Actinocorallia populi TaxID=2079200 RepID=UPI001E463AF2|nr:EamA family transporter [Actinocorallia populi]
MQNKISGALPLFTASVLWGTTGTASSLAPSGAPAPAIGAAGLVLGGLLLFLSTRGARSLPAACGGNERWLLVLGAVAVAGYPLTFYPAVSRTGVAVATVIALGSAPVFTGLLARLTGRSRPGGLQMCASAGAVLGCAALVLGPEFTHDAAPVDLAGVALALVAGLSYAVYALIGGRLIARGHASSAVMGTMFGGAALLVLPVLLGAGAHWLLTWRGAVVALHLAVFTTFLAYLLFGFGLRRVSAQTATTLTLVEPAVAALLGVAVLGERLPVLSWAGLAVLALSLVLLLTPARPRRLRLRSKERLTEA